MKKNLVFLLLALTLGGCATPPQPQVTSQANACNNDPALCRIAVTANQVYALVPDNMNAASPSAIIMKYDLVDDPASGNAVDPWIPGTDASGQTAYDYTRANGPLGSNGNLGAFGPLGLNGNLPNRFHGTIATIPGINYYNNWCTASGGQSDAGCVYGSYGPLGTTGPLNPHYYYNTMYHLQQNVYWHGNYNHNLDSTGVWGIQGPLGPEGAFGALGALGPLGISLQAGMTTTSDGVYKVGSTTVRKTQPVRYSHDATVVRTYDLYEMYSKSYAQAMGTGCSGCEINDTSFAVDSFFQEPPADGDNYLFTSNYNQFVLINVVPINALNSYALQLYVSKDGGANYTLLATSSSNAHADGGGLMNFMSIRAKKGEMFRVNVTRIYAGYPGNAGYYLFTTGSGLTQTTDGSTNPDADLWSSRLQSNGAYRFNINGAHQEWIPW